MKIETNSGSLPSWLDNFVSKIQTKKVATKNVKNLPTVNWKNETYYVNLTDDGAVLYNDQANEVMQLNGVKSIEQVNDELNKDSVVASKTKVADDGNDSTDSQAITKDNGGNVEASKSNYFDLDKTAETEDVSGVGDSGMESEIGGFGVPTDQTVDVNASINQGVEDISGEPHEGVQDIEGEPHEGIEEAGTDKYQNNAGSNDAEFDAELAKVADLENGQPQETEEGQENTATDTTNENGENKDENQQEQATTASIDEGIEDVSGEPHEGIEDVSGAPHESIEEAGTDKYQNNASSATHEFDAGNFVSKASYNRLLAKVKQLEKKLTAMDKKAEDWSGDAGSVGFQDVGNAIVDGVGAVGDAISDGASAVGDAISNAFSSRDSKKDVRCKQHLIANSDKKAEDWSGDAGSVGFQDVGNAIVDGVGAVGDAISDGASAVGDAISNAFSSRDSKKDVRCKQHLIANIPEGGINMTDLPGYDESVAGDDMSNMRIMPSEPPSNDADSRDFNNAGQFGGIFGKKKRKAYTEAQHAYTSPENDAYDLNSQDEEVKHFNESEKATQKVINKEHELDLSNMSDRAKLNEFFLDDIDKDMDVVEDALEEVPSHDELVDMVEQDPQGADEEVADTPDTEEEVVKVDDEAPTDEVEVDAPVEEVVEELPSDEDAVVVEEAPTDMPVIVTLDSPDDVDKFVNQQCPICNAKKSLQGIQKVATLTGVVCKHCGQEYAVGKDHIYLKK